jgi:hypothetical protein
MGNIHGDTDAVQGENKINFRKTKVFSFSDITAKDSFIVTLTGETIYESNVLFLIKKGSSQLYKIEFPANYLVSYTADLKPSDSASLSREIMKGFYSFLDDDKFMKPAIEREVKYDPDINFPESNIWYEIQSDTSSVAFTFKQLDETSKKITYVKRIKKIVEFF